MFCRHGFLVTVVAAVVAAPGSARAQSAAPKLSELLPTLYIDSVVDSISALDVVLGPGNIDFVELSRQLDPAFAISDLVGSFGVQVSSLPIGSSAGGFTWTFDPAMGTYNRASNTFGPTFTERALTVGRNRFNFGISYQRTTFDQVEGKDLRGEEIKTYTGALGIFFEDGLDLEVSSHTLALSTNYGVTDRLDVGLAVPIVSVDLKARLTSRVGTASSGILTTATPFFYETSGSATGIGDIVVRGKYNFWRMPGGGLAAGADLRLPTGDELDLLGIAGPQARFYVAASSAYNRLSPHVNVGFAVAGESTAAKDPGTFVFAPPDEISYAGGTDFAASPALTITGDIIGRTLRDFGRLEEVTTEFGQNFRQFQLREGSLNILLGAIGAKYNPFPNTLFTANVLFPLSDRGLTDKLTWAVGFDYSF